jgi:hypothetical protein
MDNYEEYSEEEKLSGLARDTDPDTSHIAAEKLDASRLCGVIYGIVAKYGERGCIGEEVIQALSHIRPQSVSPRFAQMIDMGMLEDTQERRVASSGYLQAVRRVKLPPFLGTSRPQYKSGAAITLLRSFPEQGDTTEWNAKRRKFLGIK